MSELRAIERLLRPLHRKLRSVVARAVVNGSDDSTRAQTLSVGLTEDETATAEHFQPFGLTANAGAGAEGIYLSVGGDRGHGVLICVMKRGSRPRNLASGEVALHTGTTPQVLCRPDGSVHIGAPDGLEAVVLGTTLQTHLDTQLGPWITRVHSALLVLSTGMQALPPGPVVGAALRPIFVAFTAALLGPPVPVVPQIKSALHKVNV